MRILITFDGSIIITTITTIIRIISKMAIRRITIIRITTIRMRITRRTTIIITRRTIRIIR